ncbi:LytTR family transcriptional regulator DNA-binding domain-containing protein [Paenibacillus sp. MAHUQ-46]|uniref:LytTR family transcriptional regulator DNA-binding domain-containing protein n=1 Tax=Paenibacillus roseus TaxID=2798579 RepID=A0A934MPJ2_9BACL|nr:LytTR family transcriptional regulator DNA-binding domain-containing protein [Paenibacillus roseus]
MQFLAIKISDRSWDETDYEVVKLKEVNYITLYRPKKWSDAIPVYHTSYGDFAPLITLRDISIAYRPHGFELYDKSTIVNTNRVINTRNTRKGRIVKFVDNSEVVVSPRSLY